MLKGLIAKACKFSTAVLALSLCGYLMAQEALQSPVITAAGSVIFSYKSPNAESVSVEGDFRWGQKPLAMQSTDAGVWTVEVENLTPDFYTYSFSVDGARTIDPLNPWIKQGAASIANMFLVPGTEVEYAANQQVPHGQIHQLWFDSQTLGEQRRMHVYTPPGYAQSKTDYPVLYLIHGGGEADSAWATIGRAGFILDNLIAAGDAVPMIVVMPNGNLPLIAPAASVFATPSAPFAIAARREREQKFNLELMNDVIPVVEQNYRASDKPQDRALAGLSMGAAYTLEVFKQNPLDFAYWGIWSMGFFYLDAEQFATESLPLIDNIDRVNEQTALISIVVGDDDFAMEGAKRISDVLNTHTLDNEFVLTDGGHTWINWRNYLHDFAMQLFK